MNAVEKMLAERACERLIFRFALLNDNRDYKAMVTLMTQDAGFVRPSHPDDLIRGRDNILESFIRRPARLSRHIITNILVDIESDTDARGISYITLFSSDDGTDQAKAPHLVGTFHDRFECQEGVWLFSERKGSIELKIR